jgi:hypothetical protein
MGFINTPELMALLEDTPRLAGQKIMPWRLEDAFKEHGANYVQAGCSRPSPSATAA